MILKQLHHRKAPLPMGDDSGRLHPWSSLHDSQAAQQIPGTSLQLGCSESPPEQFTTSMALGSGYMSCKLQLSQTDEARLSPDFQEPPFSLLEQMFQFALQLPSRTAASVAGSV